MPEYVGLQAHAPDAFGTLSKLLSIKQQRAEVEMTEQTQRQRAALAKYDFTKHIDADGLPDLNSLVADPELHAAAGDQFQEVLAHAAAQRQQQIGNMQSLTTLRTDQRKNLADIVAGLRGDKDVAEDTDKGRQKVNDALIQFGETYGDDAVPVLQAYAAPLQKIPRGKMQTALTMLGLQTASADRQIEAQAPSYLNTGAEAVNINPLAAPGTAPSVKMALSPGVGIVTDANGRQFRMDQQTGRLVPIGAAGGAGAAPSSSPTAPTQPKFTQPVPGQQDLQEHISQVRKADSDYGQNQHVNDEILRLSKNTSTGPGTDTWHRLIGKVTGIGGGNQIADYQKIGAYLDRQAAMSATQMGLPETNAGLQTAANLSGTTDYTPEALQTKVSLTSAMVEGAHQYRKGLDKIIGTGPNQDLTKLQEYRSQWADNFDPNVFRAENALRRKDKDELTEIKKEVGADGMRDLKRKSDNLRRLESGALLQ